MQIWAFSPGEMPILLAETHKGQGAGPDTLSWSPDGEFLVTGVNGYTDGRNHGRLAIWRVNGLTLEREIRSPEIEHIYSVSWSPDGRWVAASYISTCAFRSCGRVKVWSADDGRLVRSFGIQDAASWKISWSADSQWIAVAAVRHPGPPSGSSQWTNRRRRLRSLATRRAWKASRGRRTGGSSRRRDTTAASSSGRPTRCWTVPHSLPRSSGDRRSDRRGQTSPRPHLPVRVDRPILSSPRTPRDPYNHERKGDPRLPPRTKRHNHRGPR